MSPQDSAYLLALTASILFSGASVIFARFSSSHSSLFMNLMKNSVAAVAFTFTAVIVLSIGPESLADLGGASAGYLILSGMVGLAIGDYFLFRGYQRIGSARTLLVFSISPILLTIEGFLFFGQGLSFLQGLAILLMMACVWTISFEKFKQEGSWEWRGIVFAFAGVLLDNVGIVLSRMAFDASPGTSAFTANAVRSLGAMVPLLIANWWSGARVFGSFSRLEWRERSLVVFSGFFGTFLSLTLWLTAVKIGHIGGLAGVGSFNPVAASLWEWLLLRKRPTSYLIAALVLFLSGFFLLLRA
ncbi:MAG: DMT family transporter [Proteobacteria bacterium]|nr:MAG: DMT family transporter [Pseudomonadota bacterium]